MAMSGPSGGHEDEAQAFVEINITPLTDVILVLLVIFMVASTAVVENERAQRDSSAEQPPEAAAGRTGLEIELPRTAGPVESAGRSAPVLQVDEGGRLSLDGKDLDDDTVDGALRVAADASGADAPELVLAADGRASHANVVSLIERAREAGFRRVVIGTRSPEPAPGATAPADGPR